MRTAPPALLPILRSDVQGAALALLYLHPEREYTLTEVAGEIGASVKAVHQEVTRLVGAGLVGDRRVGNARLVRRGETSPLTGPLTDLLAVTYGPLSVVPDTLVGVEGIDQAYIYGSWAARYRGEAGVPPGDVDVLVVGTADVDHLDEAAREAGRRLGREVSVRRVSRTTWESRPEGNAFLEAVRSRPLVELNLHLKAARPGGRGTDAWGTHGEVADGGGGDREAARK